MNMSYPVTLKSYRGGQVGVFFADVPEAITVGTNEAEALDRAQDALLVALSGYLDDGRPLPVPSKAKRGQPVVVLPPRAAIKLAIHEAMCERGVTQAQLGEMLGIDGRQVRRMLTRQFEIVRMNCKMTEHLHALAGFLLVVCHVVAMSAVSEPESYAIGSAGAVPRSDHKRYDEYGRVIHEWKAE